MHRSMALISSTEDKKFKVSVETLLSMRPCVLAQGTHKVNLSGLIRQI